MYFEIIVPNVTMTEAFNCASHDDVSRVMTACDDAKELMLLQSRSKQLTLERSGSAKVDLSSSSSCIGL